MHDTNYSKSVLEKSTIKPDVIPLEGNYLSLKMLVEIAYGKVDIELTTNSETLNKIQQSHDFIQQAALNQQPIYGVNTPFGGMANQVLTAAETQQLQTNLMYFLKTGTGNYIDDVYVRAGMTILTNALIKGVSGIRKEIIERYIFFLSNKITPQVHELGSIGASGDLVPLASVAGAATILANCYTVKYNDKVYGAEEIAAQFHLPKIALLPKEGLALVNSTAMLTGIAAVNLAHLNNLIALAMHAHALMMQALNASIQPLDAFTHAHKPHPGQIFVASTISDLLSDSKLLRHQHNEINPSSNLYQDRYSIRCIPQFLGPVIDGVKSVYNSISIEANSVTDNPLIDIENAQILHGGNFLGEYVAIGMDQLRNYIGLVAKHLDAQIAMLVMPEFNGGLPSSLVGNPENKTNLGLKGLQISGNSIMPMLLFYGNSIADKFPTHAEQFNQNINSQGYNSALLTKTAIDLFRKYIAIALVFGTQAVDLRVKANNSDASVKELLSPATYASYSAVRKLAGNEHLLHQPVVYNDVDFPLDLLLKNIEQDIINNELLHEATAALIQNLENYYETGKASN